MDSQNTSGMNEIGTLINHETEPHCCGCYTIQYGNNGVGLRAVCNECGHTVDLIPLLASPIGPNNFGYPVSPAPLSPDVEAAVKYFTARTTDIQSAQHIDTLLRAVRATSLTGEQRDAVQEAIMFFNHYAKMKCSEQVRNLADKLLAAFAAEIGEVEG